MAKFNLGKGDRFSLGKDDEGLQRLRVELTWNSDVDLDAEAFCLTDKGTIDADADFVYYNSARRGSAQQDGESETAWLNRIAEEPYDRAKFGSKKNWQTATVPYSTDGSVIGSWDDPGGDDGAEDDGNGETIRVILDKVRPAITEIVFCLTIYNAANAQRRFSFKDVPDARITVYNADSDEELCSYAPAENFTSEDAMTVGAVRLNNDGEWEFVALGEAYDGGLQTLVDMYA